MTSCRACTYEFGSRGEALLKLGHPSPRTHPTFPPPSKQGRPAHQTCTLKQWLGPAILCVCVRVWSSVWLSAPPAGTRSACSQPPAPSSGAPPAAACLWSPSAPSSAQSTRSAACSARQSSYGDKDAQTDRQTDRPTDRQRHIETERDTHMHTQKRETMCYRMRYRKAFVGAADNSVCNSLISFKNKFLGFIMAHYVASEKVSTKYTSVVQHLICLDQ